MTKRIIGLFAISLLLVACGGGGGSETSSPSNTNSTTNIGNPSKMNWILSIMDGAGDTGYGSSIAVDSNNKLHISYYDNTLPDADGKLKYATNVSGVWQTYTIDNGQALGPKTSVVIDSNNKVHIGYSSLVNIAGANSGYFKYATNVSGSWVTSTIENGGNGIVGVDAAGHAFAVYYTNKSYNPTTYYLKYATNSSGSWQASTLIDGLSYDPRAIAVDKNGKIYISYIDGQYIDYYTNSPVNAIGLMTNASGTWQSYILDSNPSGSIGDYSAIAFDSNNKVHVCYGVALSHATNASGVWTTEKLGIGGIDIATTIDANNNVHVSFYDTIHQALQYTNNIAGAWTSNTITIDNTTYNVGRHNDIAVDSNGKVHISYYDFVHSDLKYATVQ